ncbi:hypothetical protein [Verrucomicrobium sp. BvORR034]|uniref:hypothetical protein n=1 Tax=Verrucomicrobium sp. BvORR034 TaxID=1396418 RepID=UPI000678B043|nr:hypothetical protein [Verrucomicrobium sp. BvORR034]
MKISIKKAIAEAMPVGLRLHAQPLTGYDPSPEVVLLASSRDWLLARSLGDGLEPDGYIVVSRSHVQSLITSKHRAFRKQILQAEGAWARALRTPSIDLTSTAAILRSLHKLQAFAIVVRETFEEWHSIHCRIEQVTDHHATLLGFDGAGQWERRPTQVDLSDITRIRFGSHYLKMYWKHVQMSRHTPP